MKVSQEASERIYNRPATPRSGPGSLADIPRCPGHVRYYPKADIARSFVSTRPSASAFEVASAKRLSPRVSSKLVEHLGKIIARPPFGDFVTDDMIDMNSFLDRAGAINDLPGLIEFK